MLHFCTLQLTYQRRLLLFTSKELQQKVSTTKTKRLEIFHELSELRKKVFILRNKENETIVYNGESYSLQQIAKFVSEHEQTLAYIPGFVEKMDYLPL